jgi:hypothetical protein
MITTPFAHKFTRCLTVVTVIAGMLSGFALPSPAHAGTASKSIVETGPQNPGSQVTVKLQLAKPNAAITPTAELVVVVDTSGSLAADITSMKSALLNFVNNTLANYPGAVRIGITKIGDGTAAFDSNNANNPGANYPMWVMNSSSPHYTTTPRPNSQIGVDSVVTVDSSNIGALTAAVNAITVEPSANNQMYNGYSTQPDQTNSYTSDIGPGIARGNGMFTSDNNAKYMLVLTDGLANKGFCPVTNTGGVAVTLASGTQMQFLSSSDTTLRPGDANGSYNTFLSQGTGQTDDPAFPSNYPTNHLEPGVCQNYIFSAFSITGLMADNVTPHYASSYMSQSLPKNSMLDQMAKIYGGSKSSSITNTLDAVAAKAKMASIVITDQLNPSVFASIDSYQWLANCDSGVHHASSSTFTPSGTSFVFVIGNQATITALTNICIYFYATLGSNPVSGIQPINTNSNSNTVSYNNGYGDSLAIDTIGLGSITVANNVDLNATSLDLVDASGNIQKVFTTTDPVYVKSVITNIGTSVSASGSLDRYYANQSTAVPANSGITPSVCSGSHGSFAAGNSYTFGSYPGGSGGFSSTAPCAAFWVQSTVGLYTARLAANYKQASGGISEADYTNNQLPSSYAVITPPTNLATTGVSCNSVTFNWTNGTGITSYKIHIKNTTAGTEAFYTSATSPYTKSLANGPQSYTWGVIPQVTINGVLQDGNEIAAPVSFDTTACKHFSLTTPSPATVNPGGPDYTENTSITYTPANTWDANTDTITLAIRSLTAGAFDCASIPTQGAAVSGSLAGLTITLPNGTSTQTVNALTSPVAMTIKTSSTATLGSYTLCLGGWSNASADTVMTSLTINIEMSPWIQVAGPTTNASYTGATGDVFSNGPIGTLLLPASPIQKYFFVSPKPGVLQANNSISIARTSVSAAQTNPWVAANYPRVNTPQQTIAYSRMLTNAQSNQTLTELAAQSTFFTSNACNSGTSATFHVAGDANLNSQDVSLPAAGCDGVNLIYFVDGNLQVSHNLIDQTNSGTFTFIVSGAVTVDPSVTQMDGVYVFGSNFSDGIGASPLAIHGSLIGLSGNAPSTTTGTFTMTNGKTGLQRNLGAANNQTTPAEIIYFQPKYFYLLRNTSLSSSTFSWTE